MKMLKNIGYSIGYSTIETVIVAIALMSFSRANWSVPELLIRITLALAYARVAWSEIKGACYELAKRKSLSLKEDENEKAVIDVIAIEK